MATIEEVIPTHIILHRYEGQDSRPDSITFGESTKYPGLKVYFNAQKPEELPDILDLAFAAYSLSMDKMRMFRDAHPPLVTERGAKNV
jgi:hypothetical protein